MSRALLLLTATVYAVALTAGLVLGDPSQRVAALLVTAVLVCRAATHRRRAVALVSPVVVPVVSPVVAVGGAS